MLEAESGCQLMTRAAAEFADAILGGRWAEAGELLNELDVMAPPVSQGSTLHRAHDRSKTLGTPIETARWLIARQKYLELLEVGLQKKALAVLRSELAPLAHDQDILHAMST